MRIAVDAMGGDFAPEQIILGALDAVRDFDVELILVGDEAKLSSNLPPKCPPEIQIRHASEVIPMDAHPVEAIRRYKDASIVVATDLVKTGEANAVISAGSTGAAMASALLRLGRLPGLERPAISTLIPTLQGACILLDVGANVDCRPAHLVQFAAMGSVYAERVLGIDSPRVGLLSNGEEDTKGDELTREAHLRLKGIPNINFVGNVEGGDIIPGRADVFVCDGFVGNVLLKFAEGMGTTIFDFLKDAIERDTRTKLGALLMKPALRDLKAKMDYTEYGGAPLLGVKGVCIISHGKSNAKAIRNAIRVAKEAVEQDVLVAMEEILREREVSVK